MKISAAHGFVNQVLVYTLVGIGLSGSIGVGAVWMRQQISLTANANKVLEARIADLTRRCEETTAAIAQEQDSSVLLQRNTLWGLGLVPPVEGQIVRVTEDAAALLRAKRNSGIYGDTGVRAVSFSVPSVPGS
jgi:hypothetical protein